MKKIKLFLLLIGLGLSGFAQTTLPDSSKLINNQFYRSPAGGIYLYKGSTYNPTAYFKLGSLSDLSASAPIQYNSSTGLISILTASDLQTGALSAAHWSLFNTAYNDRFKWDGSATGLVAATGRTSLGLGTSATLNATELSTPSTIAFRDGSGNTSFRSINLDTDGGTLLTSNSQTTGQVLATLSNTSGSLKWGIENSSGGNYFTGTSAYSSFFGSSTNTPVHFGTNGIVRQTISGSGATSFTGPISAPNLSGTNTGDQDLSGKANLASPTFTGTVTIPTPFTLGSTSVTATGAELNFVSGVTSGIQAQLNSKVGLSALSATAPISYNSGTGVFSISDGAISNSKLANSTISGISLGSSLATLTFGTYLTAIDASYNGSAAKSIGINATTVGTPSTIVARDGSARINGSQFIADGSNVVSATNQASAAVFSNYANTGGTLLYGIYNDSGSGFGPTNITGMAANAAGYGTTGATPVQFFTNGIVRQTIGSTGATSYTGALSASNLSGTNTGDQTSVTGNAGTATALQTARTIQGVSFDGTANINPINGTGFVKANGTTITYETPTGVTSNNSQAHSTVKSTAVIPFTTWTTFYTMPTDAGIYLVQIGLENQAMADWQSFGLIRSAGVEAVFMSQYNGSLVQTRINNMDIQVYQNGGSPDITLTYRVLRMQ